MRKNFIKKCLSITLAITVTFSSSFSGLAGSYIQAYGASDVRVVEEAEETHLSGEVNEYGLAENAEDGLILHAWNWSLKQIKDELPKIAEAGFTCVQTSPLQPNKEGNDVNNTGAWWKFYQPLDFTVGTNSYGNINKLGTKDDLKALCTEADKYGIKIIVDVVANHLANNTGKGGNAKSDRCTQIPSYLKDNDSFWHNDNYSGSSDKNRHQMTRGPIGMPDLNTANADLQKIICDYLTEAQKCGVDGFRFDAAKHIETPTDGDFASDFWKKVKDTTVANDPDVLLYGEILNTAGPGNYNDVSKYTPYIRVTNNKYANAMRDGLKYGNATNAKYTSNEFFGSNPNEWILWNESHDTYAGDYGENTDADFTDEDMAMAWCAVAARTSIGLYFSRPIAAKGDGAWKSAPLGQHTNMCYDIRIAAMNKFHNYFAGENEYVSTSSDNKILVVERGTSGVALINFARGAASVNVSVNNMEDGTYKDQITGATFTVSGGKLTGNIGSGGVAAVYNIESVIKTPRATISQTGGEFYTDTLKLTIGLKNAVSGTYKIGNESEKTFTSSTIIEIGSGMNFGDSVTVTLKATDGETTSAAQSYTFKKVEKIVNVVYLSLPSGWSEPVFCYAYDSATESVMNATWPGVRMTKDSATGYYKYTIPDNIEKPRVIFYSSDVNRTPADGQPGYLFETEGAYLYNGGNWSKYTDSTGDTSGGDTDDENVIYGNAVYFEKPSDWGNYINVYMWNDDGTYKNAEWPGLPMTLVNETEGVYGIQWPEDKTGLNVIFNDGKNQTDNLNGIMNGYYNFEGFIKEMPVKEKPDTEEPTTEPVQKYEKINISKSKVTLSGTKYSYTGKNIKPAVTVKYNGKKLSTNDYSITYSNNKNIGTAKAVIKGKNNYTGTKTVTFKINPAKVKGFASASRTSSSIKLKWDKAAGNVSGYEIFRYDSAKKKYVKIKVLSGVAKTSFVDSKRTSAAAYKYYVRAYKKVSGVTYYGDRTAVLTTCTAPARPTVKAASSKRKVTLKWNKVKRASGYIVYYKTSSKGAWKKLKTLKASKTSYTKASLKKGKKYYFRVIAYKKVGRITSNSTYKTKKVTVK